MKTFPWDPLDRRLLQGVVRRRHPALTWLFRLFSWSGRGEVWFMTMVLLGWNRFRVPWMPSPDDVLGAGLGALVSLGIGQGIKALVRRPRPFTADPSLVTLDFRPHDGSLPSTHASTAVALFVGLVLAGHPWAWIVGGWAGMVCLARVYLGLHYPSDVVLGGVLGALCGCVSWTWAVRALL